MVALYCDNNSVRNNYYQLKSGVERFSLRLQKIMKNAPPRI